MKSRFRFAAPAGLFVSLLLLTTGCEDERVSPDVVGVTGAGGRAGNGGATGGRTGTGGTGGSSGRGDGGVGPLDADAASPDGASVDMPSVVVDFLDRAANPCDDFYKFACGGFQAKYPVRPPATSISYRANASAQVTTFTRDLIDKAFAMRATSSDPETATIGNFYQSCMDAESDATSRPTLKALVTTVDAVTDLASLSAVSAKLRQASVHTFFLLYPQIDAKNSGAYLLTVDQGARRLPTRDHYFNAAFQPIRDAYLVHIKQLSDLVGVAVDPAAVMRVETALATNELDPEKKRDPLAIYNKVTFAELTAMASRFPWRAHLDALGYGPVETLNLISPAAVKGMEATFATAPIEDLKHYLRWQIVENKASFLDQVADAEEFQFHKLFSGATQMVVRRNVCLSMTQSRFARVLGRAFVERYFPGAAQSQAAELVSSLRSAFARRIAQRTWLDEATRKEAAAKLEAIIAKVGSDMKDYRITKVTPPGQLLQMHLDEVALGATGNVAALKNVPDRTRWIDSPLTVNAFYVHPYNDINLPAAVLQPPWYDPRRPPVANFATIGSVIGHELSHAFDDSGRHYDGAGNLRDWWTPEATTEFTKRAQCFGDAMGKYEALPGKPVNAQLTLGENLADNNGVRLALDAYTKDGPHAPAFQGFDERQQFFIAHAQLWCSSRTPESVINQLATDTHPPDHARINVTLSLLPEFADAFHCAPGTRQRAAMSCEMW